MQRPIAAVVDGALVDKLASQINLFAMAAGFERQREQAEAARFKLRRLRGAIAQPPAGCIV